MPYTLEVEPPSEDIRERALGLAREVGLGESTFDRPIAELNPADAFRARLARAIALDPGVLLFEHPTAEVPREDTAQLAEQCRHVAATRHVAAVALTADRAFASAAASRVLEWNPATGRLATGGWLSRFRRG
jgi:ABC-type arginine transport system ATPase subunit